MKLLNPAEAERIRAAIAEAEKATAGEIRVLLVRSSSRAAAWIGAGLAAVIGTASYVWFAQRAWGDPDWTHLALAGAIGLGVGILGALVAPRWAAERSVRRRAEQEFARLDVANTVGRTGVLLMLSLAEHRAVLLADRAIHEKVPAGTWDAIVARLVSAIRERRAADGLAQAVAEAGTLLAAHFPRRPDDVNELPDQVETRP